VRIGLNDHEVVIDLHIKVIDLPAGVGY